MKLFWTITIIVQNILRTKLNKCINSDFKKNKFASRFRRVTSGAALPFNSGSMTVEAAMVVPIFVFCMINLLYGIQVIETSSRITAAVHETGNEICSYGYAVENTLGEGCPVGVASTVYAASSVAKHLGPVVDRRGGIKGGISGINYLGSSIMTENGLVKINTSYFLKYPVNMGIKSFLLGATYYGHAWVGYDRTDVGLSLNEDDPIVYITPSGTVYHTSIDCIHLNPSVHGIDKELLSGKRNSDGSKYSPCEICGNKTLVNQVYITDYGKRYHCDLYCSGIKRDVMTVHLSEVGGRRACMTCGG